MSSFLENLKKSLETGKKDDTVKEQISGILEKSDKVSINELSEKAEKLQEARKPLTKEEIEKINADATAHEQRIKDFEKKIMKDATISNLHNEILAYEEAIVEYQRLLLSHQETLELKKKLLQLELEDQND